MIIVFYDRKNRREVRSDQLMQIKLVEHYVTIDAEERSSGPVKKDDPTFITEAIIGSIGYKSDKCPKHSNWDMWCTENDLIFCRVEFQEKVEAKLEEPEFNPPILPSAPEDTAEELSEVDLARHFNVPPPKPKIVPDFKTMDLKEIEQWEREQDNSNDIYKVKARVANLARAGGGSLTKQGEMLCNTYVHVLKSLYDFAAKVKDNETRIKLNELIRSNENMPANLIAAANVGVVQK